MHFCLYHPVQPVQATQLLFWEKKRNGKKLEKNKKATTEMDDSDSDDGHDGDEPVNKKEWIRKVSTHLNFLSGFNAFPGKRPGKLNPTIIFDAVQVFFSPPACM
jgi:hypothetical protein